MQYKKIHELQGSRREPRTVWELINASSKSTRLPQWVMAWLHSNQKPGTKLLLSPWIPQCLESAMKRYLATNNICCSLGWPRAENIERPVRAQFRKLSPIAASMDAMEVHQNSGKNKWTSPRLYSRHPSTLSLTSMTHSIHPWWWEAHVAMMQKVNINSPLATTYKCIHLLQHPAPSQATLSQTLLIGQCRKRKVANALPEQYSVLLTLPPACVCV